VTVAKIGKNDIEVTIRPGAAAIDLGESGRREQRDDDGEPRTNTDGKQPVPALCHDNFLFGIDGSG
jgi:hypothetical protein